MSTRCGSRSPSQSCQITDRKKRRGVSGAWMNVLTLSLPLALPVTSQKDVIWRHRKSAARLTAWCHTTFLSAWIHCSPFYFVLIVVCCCCFVCVCVCVCVCARARLPACVPACVRAIVTCVYLPVLYIDDTNTIQSRNLFLKPISGTWNITSSVLI